MNTIQQLMVAMTFSDGNASITPKCWQKDISDVWIWILEVLKLGFLMGPPKTMSFPNNFAATLTFLHARIVEGLRILEVLCPWTFEL